MPRLEGYRERSYENLYSILEFPTDGRMPTPNGHRFFVDDMPGDVFRTNLQAIGMVSTYGSATFAIMNAYVRTNISRIGMSTQAREVARDAFLEGRDDDAIKIIAAEAPSLESPLTRAFDQFCHAAQCTIVVGNRRMVNMSMHDWFGGPALGPCRTEDKVVKLAPGEKSPPLPWSRSFGQPILISDRQNFSVEVIANQRCTDALMKVMPKDIIPYPAIWFHVEGIMVRHVQ